MIIVTVASFPIDGKCVVFSMNHHRRDGDAVVIVYRSNSSRPHMH